MYDVIIFIVSAGPNVIKENIAETVYSISKNIGDDVKYGFYIVTDNKTQENFVKDTLFSHPRLASVVKPDTLIELVFSRESWAKEYNKFFDKYQNDTKYILFSHDDLTINTPNFYHKTIHALQDKKEPIGWISFTNDRYYRYDQEPLSNSFKDPFAIDRHNDPRIYECHVFEEGEQVTPEKLKLLDFPDGPVKLHAPFPHLCLINTDAMKKVGPCAEWTAYTILIDNDWGLEALRQNLFNVWIPDIIYTHPNPKYCHLRKPGTDLRYELTAHNKFYEKWGFRLPFREQLTDDDIEVVREKYKGTNIPLSSYKNTYDWDYLK